jgi:DNA-binding Lrp family transcriptional regulator
MTQADDLTTLLHVAGRPIRVDEASAALGLDPEELLRLMDQLVDGGLVRDTEGGISLVEEDFKPASASRATFLAGKWASALQSLNADPAEIGLAFLAAGQHELAAEHLVPAALTDDSFEVIEAAIAVGEAGAHVSPEDEGRLRLARARHCRARGDSRPSTSTHSRTASSHTTSG